MCRSTVEGGRRCSHDSSAARVMRRRRSKARQRLEDDASGGKPLTPYQQMLAWGTTTYWHSGRLQCDLDAAADRDYARRRHELFLRSLGLDASGADASVQALRFQRLHEADEHDPSRTWVREALADQQAAELWAATGATESDLYERAERGFADEHPEPQDADAAAFVIGAVASRL